MYCSTAAYVVDGSIVQIWEDVLFTINLPGHVRLNQCNPKVFLDYVGLWMVCGGGGLISPKYLNFVSRDFVSIRLRYYL